MERARLESAPVKKARHTSVIWLRRSLAGGIVVLALALVGLFWLGRSQRQTGFAPARDQEASPELSGLVLSGQGFAFELTDHGRRVFGIQAARIVSRHENDFSLEGVVLHVDREGGGTYRVASDRAVYNSKSKHALLEGAVELEGPNGVTLRTQGLEMRRHGRYLMSTSPVTFEFGGGHAGRARQLEANFRRDEFLLAGDVEVRSLPGVSPPMALDSRRISYLREARMLQADGDVVLVHGEDRLTTSRLVLQLAPDEQTPERLDALWSVRLAAVEWRGDGLPHRLGAEGHELRVTFAADGTPAGAELIAGPHPHARATVEAAGVVRALEGRAIVAELAGGRLANLASDEGIRLEEYLDLAPSPSLRLICGDTLRMRIGPTGEVAELEVDGAVDLSEPWTQARTPRLRLDEAAEELRLEGPGTWVARGGLRVASPRVAIDLEAGEVRALDGVRADMEEQGGFALAPSGEAEEPLHVVAEQARWRRDEGFQFEQSVRAWQGPNYLLAQTLGGDGDEFVATGPVKTVWETVKRGQPDEAGGPEAGEPAAPPAPLEVTAQRLRYERASRLLVYEGSARARQGQAHMLCREIRLHLDTGNELELMECLGPVQIDDPESGNKVTGQAAEYRPELDKVRVTGDPVRLIDRQGAQFEGRAMFYDLATGTAELDSRAGGAEDPFGPVPPPLEPATPEEQPEATQTSQDDPPPRPEGA